MNEIKRTRFLKQILTEEEFKKIKQNPKTLKETLSLYNEGYIDSVTVFAVNQKRFIIHEKDTLLLPQHWQETLTRLSLEKDLHNPVYVTVEENGLMLVE